MSEIITWRLNSNYWFATSQFKEILQTSWEHCCPSEASLSPVRRSQKLPNSLVNPVYWTLLLILPLTSSSATWSNCCLLFYQRDLGSDEYPVGRAESCADGAWSEVPLCHWCINVCAHAHNFLFSATSLWHLGTTQLAGKLHNLTWSNGSMQRLGNINLLIKCTQKCQFLKLKCWRHLTVSRGYYPPGVFKPKVQPEMLI